MSETLVPTFWLDAAVAIAPTLPGARDQNGESAESLERLAECAAAAAARVREHQRVGGGPGIDAVARLLHVAETNVPRLLREIVRLRALTAVTEDSPQAVAPTDLQC